MGLRSCAEGPSVKTGQFLKNLMLIFSRLKSHQKTGNVSPGGGGRDCRCVYLEESVCVRVLESLFCPSDTLGLHVIEMKEVGEHCLNVCFGNVLTEHLSRFKKNTPLDQVSS